MTAKIFAILAFLSSVPMTAAAFEKKIIFLGNPGSGKSALLNSVAGKYVAVSGLNAGGGLTTKAHAVKVDEFILVDTPGFADIISEDEIALEIENSLKEPAFYRLIFVLVLRNGRVMKGDCETINRILDAIDVSAKKFSIIFNQVREEEKEEIFDVPERYKEFIQMLESALRLKPSAVKIIDFDPTLCYREGFLNLQPALRSFILSDADKFPIVYCSCCRQCIKQISTVSSLRRKSERRQREIEALEQKRREEELEYRRLQERVRQAEDEVGCLIQ